VSVLVRDEPPRIAARPTAQIIPFHPDQLMAEAAKVPVSQASVLAPTLCPTCGAPVQGRLMVTHIQALVAAYYKLPVRAMISAQRCYEYSHPRQVAMYLAAELTTKSLPDIGKRFNRDHTTVIHAVKAVQKRMLSDPELEADVKALRERLSA
jgi:hypothetical protein